MPNLLLKAYPELHPKFGQVTYVPKIFGFKIFGQEGSKYKYKRDYDGKWLNKEYIEDVLRKPEPIKTEPPKVVIEQIVRDKNFEYNMKYGVMIAEQMGYQ